ncbi:MAG: argininosuccinate synthase domain-containing protein [Acholeplasmatales bacterium]
MELKEKIKDDKVLLALSGGVDSSVCALLLNKAIGKNLTCVFVDTGLLRLNEADEVMQMFKNKFDLNVIKVDASELFLKNLKGVS